MKHNGLKKVGFWRSSTEPNLPVPTEVPWHPKLKSMVLNHLEHGRICTQYRGWSNCRICGKMNGTKDMSDGTYIWPEGLIHYVRDHNVGLPLDFLEHVMNSR